MLSTKTQDVWHKRADSDNHIRQTYPSAFDERTLAFWDLIRLLTPSSSFPRQDLLSGSLQGETLARVIASGSLEALECVSH